MKTLILFILLSITALPQNMLLLLDDGTDVTHPSVPQNLLAVGGTGENVLTWDANTESDLYGYVIYRDSLGSELIVNGTFANGSVWGLQSEWTISGGILDCDGTGNGSAYQEIGATINTSYETSLDILNYISGSFVISGMHGGILSSSISGNGSHKIYITTPSNAGDATFYIWSNNSFVGSVDNVSVKKHIISTSYPDIPIDTVLAGTESYEDTDVTVGVTYSYRLKALDNAGNLSDYSAKAEGTPE